MSLISDALKKVEEQRAAGVGVNVLPEMAASIKRGQVRRRFFMVGVILLPAAVLLVAGIYTLYWQFPERGSLAKGMAESQRAVPLNPKQPVSSPRSPVDSVKPPPTASTESTAANKSFETQQVHVKKSVPATNPNDDEAPEAATVGPPATLPASSGPKPSLQRTAEASRSETANQTGPLQLQSEKRENLSQVYREAVYLQKQGHWQEALEAYQRLLGRVPMSAEVYNNLGVVYENQGDLKNAVKCYEKAIEIDPRFYPSFNNLGIISYKQKEFIKARIAYERALALNPNNYQSLVNLALVYERIGRLEQARRALERVLEREPDHAEALYNLARLLDEQGEHETALEHYRHFLALRPSQYSRLQKMVRDRVSRLQLHTVR